MGWKIRKNNKIGAKEERQPLEFSCFSFVERGIHILRFFKFGFERCIACRLCEFICPSVCIELCPSYSFNCLRFCFLFFISYRRCIYCGFCMHICPTDAISHSWSFVFNYFFLFYLFLFKDILIFFSFIFDFYLFFVYLYFV